jgi:protein-disulfide isomerase
MKRLFLAALLVTGCRPSDGGSQTTPSSASGTASPAPRAATDSARIDSLLGRADEGRIQGSSSAPVWLVEISDFQCPFCKRWHDEVYPTIKREYIDPGHVRMAYVHLPLSSIHPHALPAAEASLCASVQGRFWPMHDKLFDTQPMWAKLPNAARVFDSLATSVGVDMAKFSECMSSHVMRRVVNGDMARATSAGAHSTPVFFVGDEPIQGLAPIDVFRGAIARARAKAGRRPPQ